MTRPFELTVGRKKIKLDLDKPQFEGVEGRLFRDKKLPGKLIKVFKTDIDYPGDAKNPEVRRLREQALARGPLLFKKLGAFPNNLPSGFVQPEGMIVNEAGDSVTAIILPEVQNAEPLSSFIDREWLSTKGYSLKTIAQIFRMLHGIIHAVHNVGGVFSDLKPENILVSDGMPYVIDTECIAIAGFPSTGFTWDYADPLWVGYPGQKEQIEQPTAANDWYSFAVMYFELLTGMSPFAGIYNPTDGNVVPHQNRPFHGISALHKEVKLPRDGESLKVLTSTERAYFGRIFRNKLRSIFNVSLIDKRCL